MSNVSGSTEVLGTGVSGVTEVGSSHETHTTEQNKPRLAAKIEARAERLAKFLEDSTKLVAYVLVMVAWLILGFIAWIVTLVCAVIVLIALVIFRLIVGLQVHREATRFLVILQFWPDGFTSLTRAFWSKEHHDDLGACRREQTEPDYLFASLRVAYVISVIYLLICLLYNANPLTSLLTLPGNMVLGVILIALLTFGMSYLADMRRAGGQPIVAILSSRIQKPQGPPSVQASSQSTSGQDQGARTHGSVDDRA